MKDTSVLKNKGLKAYRFDKNPLELKFAQTWEEENSRGMGNDLIEWLL